MIPEETIARVRESVNLVELVRENVPGLKKAGRNYRARCPFHQERTPSFNVNPEMGVFKCFGCGVGGDAFKFVMLTEGLTYPEAIKKLASRVGVLIEEQQGEALSAEAKSKEVLYGLMEDAARFYHRHLMESAEAQVAREYLAKRGLTPESLQRFSVGFAPAGGQALREAALKKGWDLATLERAGLLRTKSERGRTYDHFWNRIIFPIQDVQGRTIAFGGRAMGDAMPKYINSPETPIYSKSRHLYGLFQGLASVRKQRRLIILEGYMDVVVSHQFGFDTTAATLGTALTEDHVRLLRRYCDRITLLFDPDNAGAQATLRGGELLMADGLTVDVVTLPDELDPDEILLRDGAPALERYLENPVPFMDYFTTQTMKRHPGVSPESKLAVAREVLPVLRRIADPLLQDEHLVKLADALRVDKAILGQQMKRLKVSGEEKKSAKVAELPAKPNPVLSLEEEMILAAMLYPSHPVKEALEAVEWQEERCRQAWKGLRTSVADGTLQLSEVLGRMDETIQSWLTHLGLQQRQYAQPLSVVENLVVAWRRRQESVALASLKQEIDSMIDGRQPMDSKKVQTYNDLSRKLKGSSSTQDVRVREAPFHG